jgi:hypothetical protein
VRSGRLAEGDAYFQRFVATHPQQLDAPEYVEQLEAALRAAPAAGSP